MLPRTGGRLALRGDLGSPALLIYMFFRLLELFFQLLDPNFTDILNTITKSTHTNVSFVLKVFTGVDQQAKRQASKACRQQLQAGCEAVGQGKGAGKDRDNWNSITQSSGTHRAPASC